MTAHIPRRILYRTLADACGGQLRHLAEIERSPRRPGHGHPAESKEVGRANRSARLRHLADEFDRRVGDPVYYKRADVPAAAAGLIVALAYGHASALDSLREIAAPGALDGLIAGDLVAISERI